MDIFRDDLSYSLRLLVGFDLVEVAHGGRLSAMGGVGPLVIVEGDPSANARPGLRAGFPVDATLADATGIVLARGPAIVSRAGLVFDASVDDGAKTAAKITELASAGIIARDSA